VVQDGPFKGLGQQLVADAGSGHWAGVSGKRVSYTRAMNSKVLQSVLNEVVKKAATTKEKCATRSDWKMAACRHWSRDLEELNLRRRPASRLSSPAICPRS
jgi:hypothetical protein